MPLIMDKMALLAKIESTYATDAAPTGAANAIQARNVQVTPIVMVREARELAKTYLGNDDDIVGAYYGKISFEVEVAGGGAPAGTAPGWGVLHRACAFAQAISAGVSVTYTPISNSATFEAVTGWGHIDGVVHKMVGMRGNLGCRGTYRGALMWTYDLTGIFVPVADLALPTAVLTAFQKPLALNKQNTPTFSMHGISSTILKDIAFDMGSEVTYRNLVNSEAVRITGRKPTHSAVFGAELMAVKNWFNTVRDGTTGAMSLVHGTTAGNIVTINQPAARLDEISYSEFEGDAFLNVSGKLMPVSGNDEVSIVCT